MKTLTIIIMALMLQGCGLWGTEETKAAKTIITAGIAGNTVDNVSEDILKAKEAEVKVKIAEANKDDVANKAIAEAIKRLPISKQAPLVKLSIKARIADIKADRDKHISTQVAKRPRWILFGFLFAVILFAVLWALREYFRRPKVTKY